MVSLIIAVIHTHCDQLPVDLIDSSVGRALHWYCRGHGFESCSGLNFFQALISQLLKLCLQSSVIINHTSTVQSINLHSSNITLWSFIDSLVKTVQLQGKFCPLTSFPLIENVYGITPLLSACITAIISCLQEFDLLQGCICCS